ncbi:hypothetical protein UlMin_004697 [Ulmus minor]
MAIIIIFLTCLSFYEALYIKNGFLKDQFAELKKLEDENNPNFVVEAISLFFEDSQKLLSNIAMAFFFKHVDAYVHQFKGSSASIGAMRLKDVCVSFQNYCEAQNLEGCLRCLQQVQQECSVSKNKLERLFMIVAAGGAIQ